MLSIVEDNITCLEQGIRVLESLSLKAYTSKHPEITQGTIGAHIRHNLDHYDSFVKGINEARIDYDSRPRNELTEKDPQFAIERMNSLIQSLKSISTDNLDIPLGVKLDSGYDGQWSKSTVRRELQFLVSHTVHHYALVAMLCRLQGLEPGEAFGVAPSTLKHRERA